VTAIHAPVEGFVDRLARERGRRPDERQPAETVVVDPPRTGMSREALGGLARMRPARIVYVSCDVATLARDVGGLARSDYSLVSVEAFDMFPNTPPLETVAVLER